MPSYGLIGQSTDPVARHLLSCEPETDALVYDIGSVPPQTEVFIGRRGPVVFLNADAEFLARLTGFGPETRRAVWHPGRRKRPDQVHFLPEALVDVATENAPHATPLRAASPEEAAGYLDHAAQNPELFEGPGPKIDPVPTDVAGRQVLIVPCRRGSAELTDPLTPGSGPVQAPELGVGLFLELYRDHDPDQAVVRATAFGPVTRCGPMIAREDRRFGFFQSACSLDLALDAQRGECGLTGYSPKDSGNADRLEASSTLSIAKAPEDRFWASSLPTTLTSAAQARVPGFTVAPESSDQSVQWRFSLAGDIKEVSALPAPARSQIVAPCIAAWGVRNAASPARLSIRITQTLTWRQDGAETTLTLSHETGCLIDPRCLAT